MSEVLTEVAKWYLSHVGSQGSLIFCLSLSFVAIWYLVCLTKLQKKRLEFQDEDIRRKRVSGDELLNIMRRTERLIARFPYMLRNLDDMGSQSILLVEDEQAIHHFKGSIEEALPHTVVQLANNGNEAWAQVLKKRPTLVITDLVMPGMNGYELIRRLALRFPEIPILIISNYAANITEIAEKIGIVPSRFEFLPKPFVLTELLNAVQRLTRNELQRVEHSSQLLKVS